MSGLLEQLLAEYTPIFNKSGLEIIKKIPEQEIMVKMDVEKMVRVFENILMNVEKI